MPQDHVSRHLDRTLELSFAREFVHKTYTPGGRPSIDPIVFWHRSNWSALRGIRSERQLMRHAADRLSMLWYLSYDLDEPLADHCSLTRIRERYGVEVFRRFCDAIVEQCQQEKLVWGKELCIDGTQVNANADLESLIPRFAVEAGTAIAKPAPHTGVVGLSAARNNVQSCSLRIGQESSQLVYMSVQPATSTISALA